MRLRTWTFAVVAPLVVVAAYFAYDRVQTLSSLGSFPSAEEAGVSFRTVPSHRDDGRACLNEGSSVGLAKELINLESGVVMVSMGEGEGIMPDDEWAVYEPVLPWRKNINRNTMFDSDCFYRSPDAPVDCEGNACRTMGSHHGYEWMELSAIISQDCLPTEDAGCAPSGIEPGAVSVTVTRKCHQLLYEGEIIEAVDTAGNRYVMHATATGVPDLSADLPEGWTLATRELDEPLVVLPSGGGNHCYHNVLRDSLGQGYHQYYFAEDQYPSP